MMCKYVNGSFAVMKYHLNFTLTALINLCFQQLQPTVLSHKFTIDTETITLLAPNSTQTKPLA